MRDDAVEFSAQAGALGGFGDAVDGFAFARCDGGSGNVAERGLVGCEELRGTGKPRVGGGVRG